MAKETSESSNQLNLTVVALVALVAIVGLVALVMNAASLKTIQLASGSQLAQATTDAQNTAGNAGYVGTCRYRVMQAAFPAAGLTVQLKGMIVIVNGQDKGLCGGTIAYNGYTITTKNCVDMGVVYADICVTGIPTPGPRTQTY